jgi:uncharacterized sulfatase
MLAELLLTAACCLSAAPADPPPNVLMIVSDDQCWSDFGFMGSKNVRTPHLDRLAAQSAVYVNGYVPTALCSPSLASILTGWYPHQHGVFANDPPDGVEREKLYQLFRRNDTLPSLLGQAGYRSFQTGKFWGGHFSNGGFSEGMTTSGRHGEQGLTIGRQTMQPIYDFIRRNREQPFFVWYAPMLPHEPHNPTDRILGRYVAAGHHPKLAAYYAMCEWFDETCGALLEKLDEDGLGKNTLVVFVVDNGWIQETGPKRTTRGSFAPKSKLSPYDGGLRTPILLRWPGHIAPGRFDVPVSSIDLAPTILDACGVKPRSELPGRSLLGERHAVLDKEARPVFGEAFLHTAIDLNDPAGSLTHRWVRQGAWKLIVPVDASAPVELYDVQSDPSEESNVARQHPEQVTQLRQQLDDWWNPSPREAVQRP